METESVDSEEVDRPRGILTQADREYLSLTPEEREANYTRQGRSNRKRQIRERLRNGVFDLDLMLRSLDRDVLGQVFKPEQLANDDMLTIEGGLVGALGLIYYICEQSTDTGETDEYFEHLLKRAVWSAKSIDVSENDNPFLKHRVNFEVIGEATVSIDKIAAKIRSGNLYELTEDEMRFYLFVQERSKSVPQPGPEAADEFLEGVERLQFYDMIQEVSEPRKENTSKN